MVKHTQVCLNVFDHVMGLALKEFTVTLLTFEGRPNTDRKTSIRLRLFFRISMEINGLELLCISEGFPNSLGLQNISNFYL